MLPVQSLDDKNLQKSGLKFPNPKSEFSYQWKSMGYIVMHFIVSKLQKSREDDWESKVSCYGLVLSHEK